TGALVCASAVMMLARADAQRSRDDPASLPEQQVGRSFSVKPQDLPEPFASPCASTGSSVLPYHGQTLRVHDDFSSQPFATGLSNPRSLLVLPSGHVIVAIQNSGEVIRL